jgi:hypothetical protein
MARGTSPEQREQQIAELYRFQLDHPVPKGTSAHLRRAVLRRQDEQAVERWEAAEYRRRVAVERERELYGLRDFA